MTIYGLAVFSLTVLAAYVLTAARARRMLQNPRAVQIVNRTGASMMAGAAIAVARSWYPSNRERASPAHRDHVERR
jgi:threonine/homoserine/homoserine lactone efflux protein